MDNRAGEFRWRHLHHQKWVNDYLSWRNKLLSTVDKQYWPKMRDFVKAYEINEPVPEHWPTGDVQNFIVKDAWKLKGELEWLRNELEKLKAQR